MNENWNWQWTSDEWERRGLQGGGKKNERMGVESEWISHGEHHFFKWLCNSRTRPCGANSAKPKRIQANNCNCNWAESRREPVLVMPCICVYVCVSVAGMGCAWVCLHCYFNVGRLVAIKRMRIPQGNYESGFLLFRIVSRLHTATRYFCEYVCVCVSVRFVSVCNFIAISAYC